MLHLFGPELELQLAPDDVVHQKGAEIADMGRGVDRGSAVVEAEDAVGIRRTEFAHPA